MPRPDAESQYRESLARLLEIPEVVERFKRLEELTVDEIVAAKEPEAVLEAARHLRVLRRFRQGVASAPQLRALRDAGFKPRAEE